MGDYYSNWRIGMIGLAFLVIGLLWLALSVFLAVKLPKWFGASKPEWRWLLGGVIFLVLLIGPFVDHIVGMRQFEKLCTEMTGLQIYPGAANAKRGTEKSTNVNSLEGFVISINQLKSEIIDLDTRQVIARYSLFSTRGGVLGGMLRMGGLYTCSAAQVGHVDSEKLRNLINRIEMTFGDIK